MKHVTTKIASVPDQRQVELLLEEQTFGSINTEQSVRTSNIKKLQKYYPKINCQQGKDCMNNDKIGKPFEQAYHQPNLYQSARHDFMFVG